MKYKQLKSIALVLFCTMLNINYVWGDTYSWTYDSGDQWQFSSNSSSPGNNSGTATLNSVSWDYDRGTAKYLGTGNSSIQFGSKNNVETPTFTCSAFSSYTITNVSVGCSSYSGGHNVSISVGGDLIVDAESTESPTSSPTAISTGTISKTGNVVISFSGGSRALYLQSISITYETGGTPTLSSISVKTAPTKVSYTEGEYFDPTGLVITRTYSDASTSDWTYTDHTSDFTFSPSLSTALTTSDASVTITYGGKSTTQTITVTSGGGGGGGGSCNVFSETWDGCDGDGGNDGTWSGSVASGTSVVSDNTGWTYSTGYVGKQCIRTSKGGYAQTPSISVTNGTTYTLSYKAADWGSDGCTFAITATGATVTAGSSSGTLSTGSWGNYSATLTATASSMQITFTASSGDRGWLDEICISTSGPNISTSGTLTTFSYNLGDGPSASQTFSVSGSGLSGDLTVTAPTNYQISLDGSSWTTSLTLTESDGSVSSTTIYVHLVGSLSVGTYNGNITISGGDAEDKNVAVNGSVVIECSTPALAFGGTSVEKILGSGKFTKIATATGNTLDAAITYSSNKTDKAEVDPATGEVTLKEATGNGSPVTITATLASKSTGVACQNEVTATYTLTIYNKVTWLVNGSEYHVGSPTEQTTQGAQITTFPEDPDGSSVCGGKEFMGWTTEANKNWSSDAAPDPLYTSLSDMSSVHINANTNYYAVFATVSGESETVYRKGTLSDLTNGKRVLIVNHSNSKALSSETSSYDLAAASVTISAGTITTTNDNIVWYVTAGSNGKKFYQGDKYLNAVEDGSYHNLHADATQDEWEVADGSSGTYILESTNLDGYYIEYYNSKFTVYTGGSGTAYEMDFYVPAAGHSAYATSCCDEVAAPTVTVDPRSNKATFDWNSQIGATNGYSLVVKEGGTTVFEKTDIAAGVTSWEVSSLSSSTTFNYTLTAKGATCSAVAMGSFTTTSCEDVPYDIYVAPGVKTATIRWKAEESTTATIRFYSDAECETELTAKAIVGATSPCNVTGLEENTQYYVKIFAGGTCASSAVSLLTQTTSVEIAEWFTDSIRVLLDANADARVVIEDKNENKTVSTSYADSLFFSKYFEAASNTKLLAIFNGTDHAIDLKDYKLAIAQASPSFTQYPFTGMQYKKDGSNHYFSDEQLLLAPGKEIILISYPDANASDAAIIKCAQDNENSGFDSYYRLVSQPDLQFNGDDAIGLVNSEGNLIDLIGAGSLAGGANTSKVDACNQSGASGGHYHGFMDKPGGWYTTKGYHAEDDNTETNNYALSSNRCLLIRRNHVKSGLNAVARNTEDFLTLGDTTISDVFYEGEWKGVQIPGAGCNDGKCAGVSSACDGFDKVGSYDYNDYYAKFDSISGLNELDGKRNDDGTYTVSIPQLDTLSCTQLKVKVYEGNVEKASREYKVPIMVKDSKTTKDTIFINSNPNQLRTAKTCKECDVVILKGGTLTKALDTDPLDADSVRNLTIYPGGTLIVPEGANYNYHVNSIQFRVQEEETPIAKLKGALRTADGQVIVSRRTNNDRYVFFSLPYDCNVSDIRWSNGETPVRGTDYEILEYDAERRAAEGSTKGAPGHWKPAGSVLKAGVGYNVATNSKFLKELIFPMTIGGANANLTQIENEKTTNKVALVQNSSESTSINNHNWNLVAHPYVSPFNAYSDGKITAGYLECTAPATPPDKPKGDWVFQETSSVYLTMPSFSADKITYEQTLSTTIAQLDPFLAVFVQAVAEGDLTFAQGNRKLTAPARFLAAKAEDEDESIFVGVNLGGNGQTDQTSVRIRPDFTNDYQLGYDLQKFTTYYTTKPQIYMKPADLQLAFQAVSDSVAKTTWMPMGVYCYHAGTYTFSLNENYPIDEVEAVYLQDKTTGKTTNLLYNTYTITTTKQLYTNTRFSLQVIVNRKAPEVATDIPEMFMNESEGVLRKILINGHVYIQRGAELYDITGKQLR